MLHSALVSGDLIDRTSEFQTCVPKLWHDNMLVVEAAACRQAPVDPAIVARMVWSITTGLLCDSLQPLEVFHSLSCHLSRLVCIVASRRIHARLGLREHSLCIRRLGWSESRSRSTIQRAEPRRLCLSVELPPVCVNKRINALACRSILEDELKPHDKAIIANESAW